MQDISIWNSCLRRVCVCVCARMCVYLLCVWVCVIMCAWVWVGVCVSMCIYVCVSMCVCVCVCVCQRKGEQVYVYDFQRLSTPNTHYEWNEQVLSTFIHFFQKGITHVCIDGPNDKCLSFSIHSRSDRSLSQPFHAPIWMNHTHTCTPAPHTPKHTRKHNKHTNTSTHTHEQTHTFESQRVGEAPSTSLWCSSALPPFVCIAPDVMSRLRRSLILWFRTRKACMCISYVCVCVCACVCVSMCFCTCMLVCVILHVRLVIFERRVASIHINHFFTWFVSRFYLGSHTLCGHTRLDAFVTKSKQN